MSRWSDQDAARLVGTYPTLPEDLALRVYTSRLLGNDASLVLHGGGNTSVKTCLKDDLGAELEVLCVKGSGWDLGAIEPQGLPAIALEPLRALRILPEMTDETMVRNTRRYLLDPASPNPSVETLLHAFLPHKFIDHTHADAVLALANQPDAEMVLRDIYGEEVGIVPYIMPGFQLAKLAAEVYEAQPGVKGLVLVNHGIFSFGETARESYERMMMLVEQAKQALASLGRFAVPGIPEPRPLESGKGTLLLNLRGALNAHSQSPGQQVLHVRRTPEINAFLQRDDLQSVAMRGPVTPDHVIRTKHLPLILSPECLNGDEARDHIETELAQYVETYQRYFETQAGEKKVEKKQLHPLPVVFLIPGLGLVTAGKNEGSARIAADIYERTMAVIENAEQWGHYKPLPESDLFDMEYWSLEQAKLGRSKPRELEGRVAVVSGAAGGLGAGIARRLAKAGCHVLVTDIQKENLDKVAASIRKEKGAGIVAMAGDLTQHTFAEELLEAACCEWGGVDFVVCNAGKAFTQPIAEAKEMLEDSLRVNLMAQHYLAAAAVNAMKKQKTGGCLLFTASKAAFNPGAGFGPYNIAKAALVALMKQYALEYAGEGIRSLAVSPDRVRTPLFDPKLLANRAAARGLTTDEYFKANLLGREVLVEDVAEACLFLLQAEKATGTFFTLDGGNLAASPR